MQTGCIAQLVMRETNNLPQFSHFREECWVLQYTYVDDIQTSYNNLDQLKVTTAHVEQILKAGVFQFEPWVFSGQSRKESAEKKGWGGNYKDSGPTKPAQI